MKQVRYNFATNALRLEYPPEWPAESITGVTVTVKDTEGNTILSATAATVLDSNALDGASPITGGDVTTTLSSVLITYRPGDRIRVHGDGPVEDREVTHWDSDNGIITVSTIFDYDHSVDATVYGMFATYTLDTTTVADYPAGEQLVVYWQPDIDVAPLSQRYEVASALELSLANFESEFKALYPREYEEHRDRLDACQAIAERRLDKEMRARNMNIERVVDQSLLSDAVLSLTRYQMIKGNGDEWEFEIKQAWSDYTRDIENLAALPIWTDDNQDGIKDDEEEQTYQPKFLERNM